MYKEDSLQFVQERLRHDRSSPLTRELRLRPPARVTRRFALEMDEGEARTFERVDATVALRCAQGSLWITHDGDPKDVILNAHDSYRAEREDSMHLFALKPCVFEIEFEDDVLTEH